MLPPRSKQNQTCFRSINFSPFVFFSDNAENELPSFFNFHKIGCTGLSHF